jgi:Flp pilus assembly protein TadD
MDRSFKTGMSKPRLALAVSTAIAAIALTGCMTAAAPRADVSFSKAQHALEKGQLSKAIAHAEAAVLADPRNPGARALLGAAYLESGRFESAATTFGDALDLGDENPRTVLSFALAKAALGEGRAAAAALDEFAKLIDPADLGLALALAGQPERGVHVLVNAVRSSDEASPKLRQNLAYAYALAGNWRAARVMAEEDVPVDQVDLRLTQWAATAAPEQSLQRVAGLLNIAPRADAGQPARLALANFPADEVLFAEAAAQAPAAVVAEAAAPAPSPAPAPAPAPAPVAVAAKASPAPTITFAEAFASPAPTVQTVRVADARVRFVSNPVVQQLPARAEPAGRPASRVSDTNSDRRVAAATPSDAELGSHLVQLGAYNSKNEAERGWAVLQSKFPQLKSHKLVITEAVVNGRTFWRVAAEGFGPNSAKALCSTVKSGGRGCFTYAAANPPAGAVQRDVRMAARSK